MAHWLPTKKPMQNLQKIVIVKVHYSANIETIYDEGNMLQSKDVTDKLLYKNIAKAACNDTTGAV